MFKINLIKSQKSLLVLFYLSITIFFASFFTLAIQNMIKPTFFAYDTLIRIGSYDCLITTNNQISDLHINALSIVMITFNTLTLISSITASFILFFNKNFNFNKYTFQKSTISVLVLMALAYILVITIATKQPEFSSEINFVQTSWNRLNYIYNYQIIENKIEYGFSSSGVAIFFFFCLEILILFLYLLYFSYKIIKKKYV